MRIHQIWLLVDKTTRCRRFRWRYSLLLYSDTDKFSNWKSGIQRFNRVAGRFRPPILAVDGRVVAEADHGKSGTLCRSSFNGSRLWRLHDTGVGVIRCLFTKVLDTLCTVDAPKTRRLPHDSAIFIETGFESGHIFWGQNLFLADQTQGAVIATARTRAGAPHHDSKIPGTSSGTKNGRRTRRCSDSGASSKFTQLLPALLYPCSN